MTNVNTTFSDLYKKFYNSELNYVRYRFTNLESGCIEEVINDSFLKIHKHLNEFDSEKSSISTWIRNITIRTAIDYYRKNKVVKFATLSGFEDEENTEIQYFVSEDSADKGINGKELKKAILRAFNTLNPKYKRIAELFFLEQKEYKEIAEICEVPLNSVKVQILRTREKLQEVLINQKAIYLG